MELREQIAVLDLLRRREAEFVKVWQCEEGVLRLLGLSDFPFDAVPDLPSRRKGHRQVRLSPGVRSSVSGSRGSSDRGVAAPGLRKLLGGEDAYHVVFDCDGTRESSFQRDSGLLRQLFGLVGGQFRLLRIETVRFRSLEDWEVCEVLWSGEHGSER